MLLLILNTIVQANSINETATVTMCAEPWAPFDYRENGKIKGIDVEITQNVFTSLGIKNKIIIMPWKKCWEFVEKGKIDMALFVAKTEERDKYIYFPKTPILNVDFVFFTNFKTNNSYKIKNCLDLKQRNFKIGLTDGNAYGQELWNCLPYKNLKTAKSDKLLVMSSTLEYSLRKLNWNKLQLVPMIKYIGLYNAKKLGLENITYYNWTIFSKPYYAVFSKKSKFNNKTYPNIKSIVNDYSIELNKFKKSDKFQKIIDNYSSKKKSKLKKVKNNKQFETPMLSEVIGS